MQFKHERMQTLGDYKVEEKRHMKRQQSYFSQNRGKHDKFYSYQI